MFTLPNRAPASRTASRRTALIALAGFAALPLAACTGDDTAAEPADDSAADADAQGSDGADGTAPITVEDAWVKATDTDMTGAFMILSNSGDADLSLVAARSDAAGMVELHEVAGGEMRAVEGGLPLPAGGELRLEPGGYHVMLMDLSVELKPGEDIGIDLEFDDGTELTVRATVKDYAGAQEDYAPGAGEASDGGGEHDDHDHGEDGH